MTLPPQAPRARFQLRIRDVLILNVYAAVLVFGVLLAARADAEFRPQSWVAAAFGIPMAMALLSEMILRPGPRRDFAVAAFIVAGFLALAGWLSRPFLAQVAPGLSGPAAVPRAPGAGAEGAVDPSDDRKPCSGTGSAACW